MQKKLFVFFQYLIPQHILSRIVGVLIKIKHPWFKNLIILWFIRKYKVDMSIAEKQSHKEYANFNDFFTRKLIPFNRPIASNNDAIISPVDGVVSQVGKIKGEDIFQAKGREYSLKNLLANDENYGRFENGSFVTLYLSPKDYHRIHMPITGDLFKMIYIPGKLFSVNPATTETVPELFAKNERAVAFFKTDCGMVAVIMIGAMIVASINTAWAGQISPNKSDSLQSWDYKPGEFISKKGEEIGFFELGSTVIMLFEAEKITWERSLASNFVIKMGQRLASIQVLNETE